NDGVTRAAERPALASRGSSPPVRLLGRTHHMGEDQPPQKKKRVISAKSFANLRPHPQHLTRRGGSKAREYVTNQELEVLNNLLDGSNHRDAARRAGLSEGVNVTSLLLRPLIDKTFKELQEKRKDQSVEGRTAPRRTRRVPASRTDAPPPHRRH